MRIKRYFGKSIRDAIHKVREEQGPDAVILSNRKVEGGVEIVAAVDFDEVLLDAGGPAVTPPPAAPEPPSAPGPQPAARAVARPEATPAAPKPASAGRAGAARAEPALADMRRELRSLRGLVEQQLSGLIWGDVARRNPLQANLLRLLSQLELGPGLCRELAAELREPAEARAAWRQALAHLAHRLPVTDDDILTRGGVVALVGPTGVGKTTTIAKLAARYAVRHGARHVGLVTTDNYRIGAHEQLRAYAKLLGVPMRVAADAAELRETLKDLEQKKFVLVDTAGMSQRDLRLAEQFALLAEGGAVRSYLVLAANTRQAAMDEVIRTYRRLQPAGCILTKVDEVGSLGGALTLLIQHRLPAAYVSDGQRVPEDLHAARAHHLVARSVAMMRRAPVAQAAPEEALVHVY